MVATGYMVPKEIWLLQDLEVCRWKSEEGVKYRDASAIYAIYIPLLEV